MKFGSREFALITGLNCREIPGVKKDDNEGGGHLKKMYFESLKIVTRQCLNVMFNVITAGTNNDHLKMTKLYFLESFLTPKQENLHIEWKHILLVDDDDLFDRYPCGRVAFNLLIEFMNRAAGCKEHMVYQ